MLNLMLSLCSIPNQCEALDFRKIFDAVRFDDYLDVSAWSYRHEMCCINGTYADEIF